MWNSIAKSWRRQIHVEERREIGGTKADTWNRRHKYRGVLIFSSRVIIKIYVMIRSAPIHQPLAGVKEGWWMLVPRKKKESEREKKTRSMSWRGPLHVRVAKGEEKVMVYSWWGGNIVIYVWKNARRAKQNGDYTTEGWWRKWEGICVWERKGRMKKWLEWQTHPLPPPFLLLLLHHPVVRVVFRGKDDWDEGVHQQGVERVQKQWRLYQIPILFFFFHRVPLDPCGGIIKI